MLIDLYPRCHARFSSLPLLGKHAEGFVAWLKARGYPRLPTRLRIRQLPRIDVLLRRRGVRSLDELSVAQLLELAPQDSQEDIDLAASVRSLAQYLDAQGVLIRPKQTPTQQLVEAYCAHLAEVRGLAQSTLTQHGATSSALLAFLGYDANREVLQHLGPSQLESFVKRMATRISRESLQHTVAHLRAFLRFLLGRGALKKRLDTLLDTPMGLSRRAPSAMSAVADCTDVSFGH